MLKKTLFILLTAATVLCAVEVTAQMGVGDHRLPAQEWLLAMVAAVVVSTVLLWMRLRWAIVLAVTSYVAFGCYHAWMIYSVVQSGNYSSPAFLPVLGLIGICPFVAAVAAAMCGVDHCRKSRS